jgi:hypothetical protein
MVGEVADSAPDLSLAIVTLVGTIATGIIALIGTIVATKGRAIRDVADKLDDHLEDAQETRMAVAEVKAALDEHVRWEMAQKYPQPWDGRTERRRSLRWEEPL